MEAPVVRGKTIWDAADAPTDVALIAQPNWYGCREPEALVARISSRVVLWPTAEQAAAGAIYLAKRLDLMPRTRLAHGLPTTDVFVALVPREPSLIVAVAPPSGIEVQAIERRPELPGGVRFAVDPAVPREALSRYAAALEAAVRGSGTTT